MKLEPLSYRLVHSGAKIDLWDPDPSLILLSDIGHHLALLCRYGGACDRFYSVAQHSCLVAFLATVAGEPLPVIQWAFMHDFAEYVLDDLGTPVKHFMRGHGDEWYERLSRRWDEIMSARFGVPIQNVKRYDIIATLVERRSNGPRGISDSEFLGFDAAEYTAVAALRGTIVPWPTDMAERTFADWARDLNIAERAE